MNPLWEALGQFLQIFVDIIPRFAIRPESTEWLLFDSFLFGVHLTCNRPVIYVPIFDHSSYWPKTEQTLDLEKQTLTTTDGKTVSINPEVAFRIVDPIKVRENWGTEYEERIIMTIRGAVQTIICSNEWQDILDMDHSEVIDEVKEYLEIRGIVIPERGFCIEEAMDSPAIRIVM